MEDAEAITWGATAILSGKSIDKKVMVVPETLLDDASKVGYIKCSVCLEYPLKPVEAECGHVFCRNCIDATFEIHTSCPTCRTK